MQVTDFVYLKEKEILFVGLAKNTIISKIG